MPHIVDVQFLKVFCINSKNIEKFNTDRRGGGGKAPGRCECAAWADKNIYSAHPVGDPSVDLSIFSLLIVWPEEPANVPRRAAKQAEWGGNP